MRKVKSDTKKIFLKKGACSHTLFFILDRKFENLRSEEEQASDPLAGGLAQEGYQCGMLWGTALGIGAECYKKNSNVDEAIFDAIKKTQSMHTAFVNVAKSPNCSQITNCDFNRKFGLAKFLLSGKPLKCFRLAEEWAPEAIKSANFEFNEVANNIKGNAKSCASLTVKMLNGTDEQVCMAAGFAGGLGLTGNACGALAAAIWMKTLTRVKHGEYKYSINDPKLEKIKEVFFEETGYKIECKKICGKEFASLEEHTEFVENGGCSKLINLLARID